MISIRVPGRTNSVSSSSACSESLSFVWLEKTPMMNLVPSREMGDRICSLESVVATNVTFGVSIA